MMRETKAPRDRNHENPLDKSTILICRRCNLEAEHNRVLRVSYCPVHGLGSPLDSRNALLLQSQRTRPSQFSFHLGKPGW